MPGQFDALYPIAGRGQSVVLPRHSRVIRLVFGDSNATGQYTTIAGLAQQSLRGNKAASEVVYRGARYYSKWLHWDGAAWVTTERSLHAPGTTYTFEPLSDHLSFTAPATPATLGTATGTHISWLMDTWAGTQLGRYLEAGTLKPIEPIYVVAGVPLVYMADSGAGATTYQDGYANGTYELLIDEYAKGAINLARAEALAEAKIAAGYAGTDKVAPVAVYVECLFWTGGGYDLQNATYSAALGENALRLSYSIEADLGGRVPTVWTRPWETDVAPFTAHVAAQASFDAVLDAFGAQEWDYVRVEGAGGFAEQSSSVFPGIHWTSNAASTIARRWCDAVNRMAARGCTLLPVTADLS